MKQGSWIAMLMMPALLIGLVGCAKVKAPALDLLPEVDRAEVQPTDAESLVAVLEYCDDKHDDAVSGARNLGAVEGAALERGACFRDAADMSIAAIEVRAPRTTLKRRIDVGETLTTTLEAYRTTHRDLCDFIVLASAHPWGLDGQVASAECEAEAELAAAKLVAAWGFTEQFGDAIGVSKRHASCYVAYGQDVDMAESQLDLQEAQLTLWACVADIARTNRTALIGAVKDNVNGFDARYIEDDFDAVVEASTETSSALCSHFVTLDGDPKSAWTALDRAACGTDAEALRDNLVVTALR